MFIGPSNGGDTGDYLVVYLTSGSVALQYNLGGGDPQYEGVGLITGVYLDGLNHTVAVQRMQNEAILTVDGAQMSITAAGMHCMATTVDSY